MYVHIVDVFVYVVLAFGCLHPCNIKWYFTVVACVSWIVISTLLVKVILLSIPVLHCINIYLISLSHAMRPGLQIRHFWVAKSLFLNITFNQKKLDETIFF